MATAVFLDLWYTEFMIYSENNFFVLNTSHTSYAFRVTPSGHLEHLHYGRRIHADFQSDALVEKHTYAPGNTVAYSQADPSFSLEGMNLEMSSVGKGDIREPFIELVHADGSVTSDFLFRSCAVSKENPSLPGLPSSYSTGDSLPDHLVITLQDSQYNLELELHYFVYEDTDVITRYTRFINRSPDPVRLDRLMSNQLAFDHAGMKFSTFTGAWAREMERTDTIMNAGKFVNATRAGVSSNRANPFVMVSEPETTEEAGDCYGMNLVYSGNHYAALEVDSFHRTRFLQGINPCGFEFHLASGESFTTPEAIMTYSPNGYSGMSLNMQHFVQEHIVRGEYQHKERPVLVNSWEASYFDISEDSLLALAEKAKDVGAELFVMDDGWFGSRNDDTTSLGDWTVNRKKLPDGVDGLCRKINEMGLDFGIWVEPEMISEDSDLYRNHPDWALAIPGHPHSEGRNQRVLDLTRKDVQDFIIETMSRLFSGTNIKYVKWDFNRIMSDVYSSQLPPEREQEVSHRYILGLYRVLDVLTRKFPHILFEGCAAGGNRFDLGMLCYFPQIWASDNTDALCRVHSMTNYSYGYPMSTVSAHVSACPNHQTLRTTPMETRFNVSAFGVLGYELDLTQLSESELTEIRTQIALYKKYRKVFQFGDFYRGRNRNIHEWHVVSPERDTAVGMVMQELTKPNMQYLKFRARGLDPERKYHFYNISVPLERKIFGHIVSESESYFLYGDALMYSGVKLFPAFAGVGVGEHTRIFSDFSSRLYFMEDCAKKSQAVKT